MKKFDFRRQLKTMNLDDLIKLKDYHTDLMLSFTDYNQKESSKQLRYLGYIDNSIEKLKANN